MKFLIIDYRRGGFAGANYYFAGFQDGFVKGSIDNTKESRFYFNGSTENDCLEKAYEYCSTWEISINRIKFKLLLDKIKSEIE